MVSPVVNVKAIGGHDTAAMILEANLGISCAVSNSQRRVLLPFELGSATALPQPTSGVS
jgi:hypothetical protein